MVDALVTALAILLWLVTLVNVLAYLRTRDITRAWLVGIFVLLAIATSLCVSAATAWIAEVGGVRSMADAIERTAVMGACFCAQSLLRQIRSPGQGRLSWQSGRLHVLLIASFAVWLVFVIGN